MIENIRRVKAIDKKEIIDIAYSIWSKELDSSDRIKRIIYDFLVSYYFKINDLTYVYNDDGVKAFALACLKSEMNFNNDSYLMQFDLNDEELEYVERYIEYIESNSIKVLNMLTESDVYFGLLASTRLGAGTFLIDNLKEVSKAKGYKRIFFWTDETCSYKYYERKGFNKVNEYEIDFFGSTIKTFIYRIDL